MEPAGSRGRRCVPDAVSSRVICSIQRRGPPMSLLAGYLPPFLSLHQLHPVRPPLHALPPANATQRSSPARPPQLSRPSLKSKRWRLFCGFDRSAPGYATDGYGMGLDDGMPALRHGKAPQGEFANVRAHAMAGQQIEAGYLENVHRLHTFPLGGSRPFGILAFYLEQ